MADMRRRAWIDLKQLRLNRGWRQWEAAEKLGVSRTYVSAVENGRRGISMTMMDAIIQVFGVSYEDFLNSNKSA